MNIKMKFLKNILRNIITPEIFENSEYRISFYKYLLQSAFALVGLIYLYSAAIFPQEKKKTIINS